MILHPADLQRRHFVVLGNAAEIGPNSLLVLGFNPGHAILGAENDVVMQRCVGVCHSSDFNRMSLSRSDTVMVAVGFNPRFAVRHCPFVA